MNSVSNIKKTFLELNEFFQVEGIDNKALVLDFSHFTKVQESHSNIKIVLFGYNNPVSSYKRVMEEEASHGAWKKFSESSVKLVSNFQSNNWIYDDETHDLLIDPIIDHYINVFTENNFNPRDLTSTLKNGPGKSMLFLAKSFNDDEAQSIIYVTLKNPIPLPSHSDYFDFKISKNKLSLNLRELLDNCFSILEELLVSEMVHSLYENWQNTDLERQKILARETERNLVFKKLFHSQKQHLALLSHLAKEIRKEENEELASIVDYTQQSLSEFLDIHKYLDRAFDTEDEDIVEQIRNLVSVLETITKDREVLKQGIRLRRHQYEPIVQASIEGKLFQGNFRTVKLEKLSLPLGIPKLILKEIIVNAIQHSKWDEPEVIIDILDDEKYITICISNKVEAEMIDKLYEEVGLKNHGRDLIESLSKKINWQVKYTGEKEDLKVYCKIYLKK